MTNRPLYKTADYTIFKYDSSYKTDWNDFIDRSKSATFLFHRDFMEYHQERFDDFSLMLFHSNELIAVLPAHKDGPFVYSHRGLSYGGLVFSHQTTRDVKISSFKVLMACLKKNDVLSLEIKKFPDFYGNEFDFTDTELLTHYKIEILQQSTVLALPYHSDYTIHKTKLKRFRKLESKGFEIRTGFSEFERFWNQVLIPRLAEKHQSKPVHTLQEIEYLHGCFKDRIFQYNMYHGDDILAGITIFNKGTVVKSQYGIATAKGEKEYALDMLFVYLIRKYETDGMQYFSMGTVDDNSELGINEGMLKQKQELGCKTYSQDILKIQIDD
ncbi:MAG: GNAT family N-acetyltransferase [Algicola sp.]|nr:GNAT family N-acetyltransferase [Algicola sp.]